MVLLPVTTIGAAGTITTPAVHGLRNMGALGVQPVFVYGAGGTSVTAYIQTSLDNINWFDIVNVQFLQVSAIRVTAVNMLAVVPGIVSPSDGSLANNSIVNGLLGPHLRAKITTAGTYTGLTTLAIYVAPVIMST